MSEMTKKLREEDERLRALLGDGDEGAMQLAAIGATVERMATLVGAIIVPEPKTPSDAEVAARTNRCCILLRDSKVPFMTWCGRESSLREMTFTSAAHAALSSLAGSYARVCPSCAAVLARALFIERDERGR